ncbi:hypothetical protein [uncultured Clostridium sp.]|uniref:hypothetical protein n=1 Tax=uncultured Clostridium sp. TaxID=59620 RepID=UPI0025D80D3E|nr:hypothetical protein [uncultured Clostridium sp.]
MIDLNNKNRDWRYFRIKRIYERNKGVLKVNKYYKKYILKKAVPIFILSLIVIFGLIHINIINTKALSPLGNTKQNYELVSEKFGNDFANFIKDNSFVKIYPDCDDGKVLVRLGDEEFKITSESQIVEYLKDKINSIK